MSYVGKNIKKIRSVKNLNQTKFAELFDLKRASIGAYEEGRAEPKIATLSQIANHFGISVDDLLHKELSVNDLYHFDIFQKDYIKNKGNQLKPSKLPVNLASVYYIVESKREDYFKGLELSNFIKLSLPIPSIASDYIAFESNIGNPWLNASGDYVNLLVCRAAKQDELAPLVGKSFLIWKEGSFFFGMLSEKEASLCLRDYRHAETIEVSPSDSCFLALYEMSNSKS